MSRKKIRIKEWFLEIDREKTREIYKKLPGFTCDCAYCRNYLAAYHLLPKKALRLFNTLGIDPVKDTEVFEYSENKDGTHMYGGMFLLVGKILEGRKDREGSSIPFENPFAKEFDIFFLQGLHGPQSKILDFIEKDKLITLEVTFNIPWVIEPIKDSPYEKKARHKLYLFYLSYILAGSLGIYLARFLWLPLVFAATIFFGGLVDLFLDPPYWEFFFYPLGFFSELFVLYLTALITIYVTHFLFGRQVRLSKKALLILSIISVLVFFVLVRVFSHPVFESWIFN